MVFTGMTTTDSGAANTTPIYDAKTNKKNPQFTRPGCL